MVRFSRPLFVTAALLLASTVLPFQTASAGFVLSMDGQTDEFSQSGGTFGGNIKATFADTGSDEVTLTLDASGITGPSTLKIGSFYFNITGVDPLSVSATSATPFTFSKGTDAFKADGDGFFDFRIDFANNGPGAFTPGELASFVLSGPSGFSSTSLFDISVNGPVGKNGFYAAAHVQAIDGGSGWFKGDPTGTPDPLNAVPEPSTLVSASLGLVTLGLVALRRRRLNKVA